MKCIKCGHRRLSRVFLGMKCLRCREYYCYAVPEDWNTLIKGQKYTCKELKNGIMTKDE
jgi:hypothetical protein